jgi:hypothetical protein
MSNEYYPLPSEVSITESCKFIPRCLLNFIVWLINDSCFYQENNNEGISNDILIFRQMPFGINNLDCDLEIS